MAEAVRLANDSRVLFETFGASDEERSSFARDFKDLETQLRHRELIDFELFSSISTRFYSIFIYFG